MCIPAEKAARPEQQGRADPFSSLLGVGADCCAQFFGVDRFRKRVIPDRIIDPVGDILQFNFYIRNHKFTTIFS